MDDLTRWLVLLFLETLSKYDIKHRRRADKAYRKGAPVGETSYDNRQITIWPKRATNQTDLLDTVVHEIIHAALPELSEHEVRRTTKVIMTWVTRGRMSKRGQQRLKRILERYISKILDQYFFQVAV